MSKLFVMAKVIVKAGTTKEAKELLTTLAVNSKSESGCLSYKILASAEEKNTFITLEVWDSIESEQLHWKMPHLKRTLERLQLFLVGDVRIEKFSNI
ncbi:putative quinol monooxygenase [Microbulbifer sp. VAAC004]|uniref:putative quinol monooxygenase n=1 Tax=unclassified Microbulbifer TaxID=2619833 RepID=UPI00403945CF